MAYVDRLPLPLANNPTWTDFVNAMEQELSPYLVDNVQKLLGVRDVNNFAPQNLASKVGNSMLSGADASYNGELWNNTQWRVQLATMLGFTFYSVFNLPTQTFDQFVKLGVGFYTEQGTQSWVDFLGFATDSVITVTPLWAQVDPTYKTYINFQPAGSPQIGTPVWEGGSWYPTSHVDVTVISNFSSAIELDELLNLLRFVAPINICIRNIIVEDLSTPMTLQYGMAGTVYVEWDSIAPNPDVLGSSTLNYSVVGAVYVEWASGPYSPTETISANMNYSMSGVVYSYWLGP